VSRRRKISKSDRPNPLIDRWNWIVSTIGRWNWIVSALGVIATILNIIAFFSEFSKIKWSSGLQFGVACLIAASTLFVLRSTTGRVFKLSLHIYEQLFKVIRPRISSISAPTAATTAIAALANRKRNQKQIATMVILVSLAIYTIARLWSNLALSVVVIITLAGAALLLQLADAALGYRIHRGLYGTNEYEARQIIYFALSHAEKSDLSGGLGAADMQIDQATEKLVRDNWGVATS
jgi:hypothetical protein